MLSLPRGRAPATISVLLLHACSRKGGRRRKKMEGPLSGAPGEERAYKRDPVLHLAAKGRPSLWDRRCRRPRAAYPGASNGPFAPCLALLRAGLAEPRRLPAALVSSYLTVSPLPATQLPGRRRFVSV